MSDNLGLQVHGSTGYSIIDYLHSLTDSTDKLGFKSTIGNFPAFHFLKRNFHVFDQ